MRKKQYNPELRKKEKVPLQGIWDGEQVKFDHEELTVIGIGV